ncbi:MAG: ABC transporter substrate-binding protein [Bacteroidota bacterium]|jgi:ABC-type branched-subunit amino acid transport system substrate-binding protein
MLKRLLFALILLSNFQIAQAQKNASEYETAYKKALQTYKNADFENAQIEFGALCNNRIESPLVPYSFYFNALSSTKLQKYFEAKTTLKNLLALYPNWSKKDEINYIFANIAFEEKNYVDAFNYAKIIADDSFQDDLAEMKAYYIGKIKSPKVLQELSNRFPDESVVIENKNKISSGNTSTSASAIKKSAKGYFNFGILLPLDIETLDPEKTRKNQYAIDIYQGMKMARTMLIKEGITINLFTYDMANNADEMLELINNESFQKMDLLVGPLYSETNKVAAAFCETNEIPIINPMSNNKKILDDYYLSFLAQPSAVMQANKAVDFVRKQAFLGRNTAIYYTDSPNDSIMAETYRQQMQKVGYEIVKFEKILPFADDIGYKLPDKKVSHIFMATSDKKAGLSMINALNKKDVMYPLITTAEAFNSSNLSNGTLAGREVYCLDPEFVDTDKPEVDGFRKDYLMKYGVIPSYYAFHGYDIGLFWGRLLGRNGTNIRKGLDNRDAYKDTYNLAGFNYIKSQDNQVLPITTFQNYKFVLAR